MKFDFIKIALVGFAFLFVVGCAHDQDVRVLNARAARSALEKDYSQAIKLYSKVINLDSQFESAYLGRGNAFLLSEKYDEAIKDFDESIRLNPTNYLTHQLRGTIFYARQEFDKAIADLTVALNAAPGTNIHAWNLRGSSFKIRGICFSWQHNYTNAIADLTQALNFRTNDYKVYERRGVSYLGIKEFDKAFEDFTNAIRLNPEALLSIANLGRIYSRNGLFTNAIQNYEFVIRRNPEAVRIYNALAWLLATCPDERIRDGKRAVELATKACKLSCWENYDYIDTLAAAYAEEGNFEAAIKFQKQVIDVKIFSETDQKEFQSRLNLYLQRKTYCELKAHQNSKENSPPSPVSSPQGEDKP